jgi:phage-related protein
VKGSIDEAEKLEKAQRSLDAAIEHTGGNVAKQRPVYDATAKAAAQYGVSQADATQMLARALLLTGDSTKAQHAYQEALVISKATGKDFNSVLTATSKGQNGVTTSLQRYGIAIKTGTPGTEQFRQVMARWGDQAKANTTNMDKLKANAANLGAQLGGPLLGALNLVAGALSGLIGFLQQNKAILEPLAAVIGITATALGGFLLVTEGIPAAAAAAAAGIDLISISMLGLPITWIVLAIAAVVVGLVELWKHSQTFRDIVIGTWHAVRDAAVAVFGAIVGVVTGAWDHIRGATDAVLSFLKEHWRAAVVALATILLGPLGGIVALIITHWGEVKSVTVSVWNAVKSVVSSVVNGIRSVVSNVFGALAGIVRKAVAGVRDGIGALRSAFSPVLSILHAIENAAHAAFDAIGKIAGAAGKVKGAVGGALHHIPGFAGGVTNYAGGLAIVGEYGPELVTLPRGSNVLNAAQSRSMLAGAGGGPDGPVNVTVTHRYFPDAKFTVLGTTDRQVATALKQIIEGAPHSHGIHVVAR